MLCSICQNIEVVVNLLKCCHPFPSHVSTYGKITALGWHALIHHIQYAYDHNVLVSLINVHMLLLDVYNMDE